MVCKFSNRRSFNRQNCYRVSLVLVFFLSSIHAMELQVDVDKGKEYLSQGDELLFSKVSNTSQVCVCYEKALLSPNLEVQAWACMKLAKLYSAVLNNRKKAHYYLGKAFELVGTPGVFLDELYELLLILSNPHFDANAKDERGEMSLHRACRKSRRSQIEEIDLLLRLGARINESTEDGITPLHIAVGLLNRDLVKFLLDRGANGEAGKWGVTPLHLAIALSNSEEWKIALSKSLDLPVNCEALALEIIQLLLPVKTDLSKLTTIVQVTSCFRSLKVFEFLSTHYDLKLLFDKGLLRKIVSIGATDILKFIEKRKGAINGKDLIWCVADADEVEIFSFEEMIIRFLTLSRDGSVKVSYIGKLLSVENYIELLKFLIHSGGDINCVRRGKTLIEVAAWEGKINLVKALASLGALMKKGLLHQLMWTKVDEKMVEALIECGAGITEKREGATVLHVACSFSASREVIECLLSKGAQVGEKDSQGNTALHRACKSENPVEIVSCLLRNRAQIDVLNNEKLRPIDIAILEGNGQLVRLLIKNGATCDGSLTFKKKTMPYLFFASEKGFDSVIEALIENGNLEVDEKWRGQTAFEYLTHQRLSGAKDKSILKTLRTLLDLGATINSEAGGNTLLHQCARVGDVDLVRILIEYGASVETSDNEGNTPLEIALENGHGYLADILRTEKVEKNESGKIQGMLVDRRSGKKKRCCSLLFYV